MVWWQSENTQGSGPCADTWPFEPKMNRLRHSIKDYYCTTFQVIPIRGFRFIVITLHPDILSHICTWAPCGLRGCKNGPAPFPGRMSYKVTKPGLVCLSYLSMLYYCIVVYYGPFLCIVSFCCYVFCLLVVLAKLSLLAKLLARKTPLRKPNCGEGIISIKPRPKSTHDFLGLLYCFIVLLCICVFSCPYVIYCPTVMARYSLFVLKVPLNPKQANKQTNICTYIDTPWQTHHKISTIILRSGADNDWTFKLVARYCKLE